MKILLLNTDDYTGGAAIACRRLLKALKLTNVNAKMLVQESKNTQDGIYQLNNNWLTTKMAWLRFVAERLFFFFFEKSKEIRFLFNPGKFGIDITDNQLVKETEIIHLHWINFGFLSINSINRLGKTKKPVVWTLHDMWAFTGGCHHAGSCENYQNSCGNCIEFLKKPYGTDLSNQIWEEKKNTFVNLNLTIVTCSEWLANRARKSSLLKDKNIITIPNPIDTALFEPKNKELAKLALKLNPHKKYILLAAMNINAEGKGYSYFKDAILEFTKLNNSNPSAYELLIMGKGIVEDFEDLPLKVNFLGQLSDQQEIINAYNAAEIFVIPSLAENLPNTIMEAMACGVPVVGFYVGGIPEMIDHQKTGYLAEYKSASDLAKGINFILKNTEYQSLSNLSRNKVLNYYAEEVVAKKYIAVYESLLK